MTSSEPQAKKTRDLPNLSECHCCHLRVDLAKAKNKLQILYSEWRIVLLCNKCLARVESTELCSYCFNDSSSDDCFSCLQCKRRVHKHCDSEYRSVALWSGSSLAVEVSVCADCWVPESLARWRSVVRSRKKTTRRNRVDLELGRSRVSGVEIEGSGDADTDVDGDPKSSVCVCDSSTEVGCLKLEPRLDLEEEEEEEEDDDGPFKEGEGSCSNGVDLESPPSYKQEDCNCITRPEGQKCDAKLDPYYFKYRRRSTIDHSLLTYKRRITVDCGKSLSTIEFPMLTYKRRSTNDCCMLTYKRRSTVNRIMLTYKRRRIFDHSMFIYKRRRPEILTACSKIQGLEG